MSNTTLLTLSARIAELERTARSGQEAQDTLKQLYQEQKRILDAIEAAQNTIYSGEDADATLARLRAALDGKVAAEAQPVTEAAATVITEAVVTEAASPSGLQNGEVLVVGAEATAPDATPNQEPEENRAATPTARQRLLLSLARSGPQTSRQVAYEVYLSVDRASSLLTSRTGLVARGLAAQVQGTSPNVFEITEQGRAEIAPLLGQTAAPPVSQKSPVPSAAPEIDRQALLLADLAAHPDASTREIGQRLGWTNSTTAKWITRLTTQGLLLQQASEWRFRYRLSGQAEQDQAARAEAPEVLELAEPTSEPLPRPDGTRAKMIAHLATHGPRLGRRARPDPPGLRDTIGDAGETGTSDHSSWHPPDRLCRAWYAAPPTKPLPPQPFSTPRPIRRP